MILIDVNMISNRNIQVLEKAVLVKTVKVTLNLLRYKNLIFTKFTLSN